MQCNVGVSARFAADLLQICPSVIWLVQTVAAGISPMWLRWVTEPEERVSEDSCLSMLVVAWCDWDAVIIECLTKEWEAATARLNSTSCQQVLRSQLNLGKVWILEGIIVSSSPILTSNCLISDLCCYWGYPQWRWWWCWGWRWCRWRVRGQGCRGLEREDRIRQDIPIPILPGQSILIINISHL